MTWTRAIKIISELLFYLSTESFVVRRGCAIEFVVRTTMGPVHELLFLSLAVKADVSLSKASRQSGAGKRSLLSAAA